MQTVKSEKKNIINLFITTTVSSERRLWKVLQKVPEILLWSVSSERGMKNIKI